MKDSGGDSDVPFEELEGVVVGLGSLGRRLSATPALLTRRLMYPWRFLTVSTSESMESWELMSHWWGMRFPYLWVDEVWDVVVEWEIERDDVRYVFVQHLLICLIALKRCIR